MRQKASRGSLKCIRQAQGKRMERVRECRDKGEFAGRVLKIRVQGIDMKSEGRYGPISPGHLPPVTTSTETL